MHLKERSLSDAMLSGVILRFLHRSRGCIVVMLKLKKFHASHLSNTTTDFCPLSRCWDLSAQIHLECMYLQVHTYPLHTDFNKSLYICTDFAVTRMKLKMTMVKLPNSADPYRRPAPISSEMLGQMIFFCCTDLFPEMARTK